MFHDRAGIYRALRPETLKPIDYSDGKIAFAVDRCRGKRVLDLGCVMHHPLALNNPYFLHRALQETAARVVGLDLHEEGVANLRAHGYDVRVGNAEAFRFDDTFDVIVAGDIIEHIADHDGFLRSVDAALAEGGALIVMSPNPWYWRNSVKAALDPEVAVNPEHTCWFCPRTWRQLVERYGFTVGAIEHHSRYRRDRWMPLPRGLRMTTWCAETLRGG